mgnify:CR=1 FL=1
MSDDKEKDKLVWFSTPWNASNYFYDKFMKEDKPVWIGIDWAEDSGMNRGDIIKGDTRSGDYLERVT